MIKKVDYHHKKGVFVHSAGGFLKKGCSTSKNCVLKKNFEALFTFIVYSILPNTKPSIVSCYSIVELYLSEAIFIAQKTDATGISFCSQTLSNGIILIAVMSVPQQ